MEKPPTVLTKLVRGSMVSEVRRTRQRLDFKDEVDRSGVDGYASNDVTTLRVKPL